MGAREAIVKALLKGKPGGATPEGIHVYHSSPHDFDKFDWAKLRTGEGANTYGAGFYFAENPAVSGQGGQYWRQFLERFPEEQKLLHGTLQAHQFDRTAVIEANNARMENARRLYGANSPEATPIIERLQRQNEVLRGGDLPPGPRTYEVNIAARPELMLDWDKPIGQQADLVKDIAKKVGIDLQHQGQFATANYGARNTGGDFYVDLARELNPPDYKTNNPAASKMLAEYGIPGIRYLDQGSRILPAKTEQLQNSLAIARNAADPQMIAKYERQLAELQPSYNYVVTDPSKLDILGKYGVVGTAGGGLGVLAAQDQYGEAQ